MIVHNKYPGASNTIRESCTQTANTMQHYVQVHLVMILWFSIKFIRKYIHYHSLTKVYLQRFKMLHNIIIGWRVLLVESLPN